ncbi:hypothetical protein TRIUR3_30341 [Triticum urartu]|uniref:Disease resistance RPP13-like protein 1 n=1 Tax=Triticum urartu TaxID=4572 RepID=M7ZR74_TRIUA|nr:hypothetical protein TRIUR3_30341 [Triticum urartu]
MGTLEPLSNLSSLTRLELYDCGEDLKCQGLWSLLTTGGQLNELAVMHSPRFFADWDPNPRRALEDAEGGEEQQAQLVSSTLRELRTDDVAGLLAAPVCSFLSSSLTKLELIGNWCEGMEWFSKEQEDALQLLSSLQELVFKYFEDLQQLPAGLRNLTSLKILAVKFCPAISSLPSDALSDSLQKLHVYGCNESPRKQQIEFAESVPTKSVQAHTGRPGIAAEHIVKLLLQKDFSKICFILPKPQIPQDAAYYRKLALQRCDDWRKTCSMTPAGCSALLLTGAHGVDHHQDDVRDSLAAQLFTSETCLASDGSINRSRLAKEVAVVRPVCLPSHAPNMSWLSTVLTLAYGTSWLTVERNIMIRKLRLQSRGHTKIQFPGGLLLLLLLAKISKASVRVAYLFLLLRTVVSVNLLQTDRQSYVQISKTIMKNAVKFDVDAAGFQSGERRFRDAQAATMAEWCGVVYAIAKGLCPGV